MWVALTDLNSDLYSDYRLETVVGFRKGHERFYTTMTL